MAMMAITTRSSIRVNALQPEQKNRFRFTSKSGWITDGRFTQTGGAVNADLASDADAVRAREFSERRIVLAYREFIEETEVVRPGGRGARLDTTTKPAVDSRSPQQGSGQRVRERGFQKSATIRWNE